MKKLFSIFIIFTISLSLTACKKQTNEGNLENEKIVTGFSLDEAGLEIIVPDNVYFQDPNYDFETSTFFHPITIGDEATWPDGITPFPTSKYITDKKKINGSLTALVAVYSDDIISASYETMMVLQAFNAKEIVEGNFILINNIQVPVNDLNSFIIFQEDSYIVYDFYYLLRDVEFSQFVEGMNFNKKYNYLWLNDIYNYFDLNIDKIISHNKKNENRFVLEDYDAEYMEIDLGYNNSWIYVANIRFIEEFKDVNEGKVVYNNEENYIKVIVTTSDGTTTTGTVEGYTTYYIYNFKSNELEIETNGLELSDERLIEIAGIFKNIFLKYQIKS